MCAARSISVDKTQPAQADTAIRAGNAIISQVLDRYLGPVAVRLWDGQLVVGNQNAPCTLVFRDPGVLRELVFRPDLHCFVQAHLADAVAIEGDLELLFDLYTFLMQLRFRPATCLRQIGWALRLPRMNIAGSEPTASTNWFACNNSRASIAHHYDLGNDFYGLWLDPEYVYSCAYFRDSLQSLAQAQQDKLDYICRKLRLAPGQHLLDIGCGWGALALWAARHYSVQVHGITLSTQQQRFASERVRQECLGDLVKIEVLDYRDLEGSDCYDRIVSVGMFEHVGVHNFPRYFGAVRRLLKPSGLFLNHGITSETGWQSTPLTRFMNSYIFPDGELAKISDVMVAMEQSGFELLDVESLRPHYTLTLHHWLKSLETYREAAINASNEAIYRLWRLYMAGSAYYFQEGSINVYQMLAGLVRCPLSVPLRRDDLYVVRGPGRSSLVAHASACLEGKDVRPFFSAISKILIARYSNGCGSLRRRQLRADLLLNTGVRYEGILRVFCSPKSYGLVSMLCEIIHRFVEVVFTSPRVTSRHYFCKSLN